MIPAMLQKHILHTRNFNRPGRFYLSSRYYSIASLIPSLSTHQPFFFVSKSCSTRNMFKCSSNCCAIFLTPLSVDLAAFSKSRLFYSCLRSKDYIALSVLFFQIILNYTYWYISNEAICDPGHK